MVDVLHLFRKKEPARRYENRYEALMEALAVEDPASYRLEVAGSTAGREVLAAGPEEQRAFVLAAIAWLERNLAGGQPLYPPSSTSFGPEGITYTSACKRLLWPTYELVLVLLKHTLPFGHDDLILLLDWTCRQRCVLHQMSALMLEVAQRYLRQHPLTPALQESLEHVAAALGHGTARVTRLVTRLRALADPEGSSMPLVLGDAWSDAAVRDLEAMERSQRLAWWRLLSACLRAAGSTPSAKWLKATQPLVAGVGLPAFKNALLSWFPLAGEGYHHHRANEQTLRGLAWLCGTSDDEEIARAVGTLALASYKKIPGYAARSLLVGGACAWALSQMPGLQGSAQLALLKARVRVKGAERAIEEALSAAAGRAGVSPAEIEEVSAPTCGLEAVGVRREALGEFTAELTVTGTSAVELAWLRPDGKRQTSVPQVVGSRHAEELGELKGAVREIRRILPAQRDRLERLYVEPGQWTLAVWRERYLDHPLVGTLARRLIWKFSRGDRAASGLWHEGHIVERDGQPLDWLDDATRVELWHPLQVAPEVVLEWRQRLLAAGIQQPFKQAYREVYLLTDAERQTATYSNRFAAHIVKQHQFEALCRDRRWKSRTRILKDDEDVPASRLLPACGLRVEFWVQGAVGDDPLADVSDVGAYLYLATDQVRFYALGAPVHRARAGLDDAPDTPAQPLPLAQVAPLVFSEVMRDVDLFVGVASVGNDPTWVDGGPGERYREYWARYAFGDLSEIARTRRQVLESLLPRLAIAGRCRLTERFLVVRGDLRTYKIHLGSGSILMEPNDEYLCIVPRQGAGAGSPAGQVFLPFAGDGALAVILSKAFLLAEDTKIKDPTILSQILT